MFEHDGIKTLKDKVNSKMNFSNLPYLAFQNDWHAVVPHKEIC